MKNIKGFTMIELLATIIILGLLTTLAYYGVSAILNRGSNSYYTSQENMIVLAGKEYFADYRAKLPKDIGDTSSVTLDVLIKEQYIEPVKDEDENECNRSKTTVVVQKITDTDYQYYITLVCDSYTTTEDTADPVVIFSPNKKSSTKAITVSMEVTDNKDVASYRYVITKDGEEYRDSEYQNYTGPVTIKLTEKGLYEIVGYAYDSSGNRGSKRSGKYSIYKGINCAEVEFDSNVNVRTWTNKDITVTMKLPDNTYRWELSKRVDGGEYEAVNSYIGAANRKISFDSEGKHQLKLVVYDDDGNSCIATTGEYYIDKTAPTCTSSGGSSSWTNDDRTLKGTCSDKGGSGCTGNVTKIFDEETDKTNQSPGTVKDKAGNSTKCPANQTVKIDKTAPTCKSSGGSSSWTNGDRTLKGTCSDKGGSGCAGNVTKLYDEETDKTNQSPGTVKDKAGNSTKCPANQTVKIDKTAPTCKSSGGSNSWTDDSITLKGTCSDKGGSGCVGNVSKTFNSETNTTKASPGTVKDKAGNTTTCPANQTVRIDKTAPTCTSSGGSNSWTNDNRILVGICDDGGGSGCVANVSKNFNSETNTTKASPGTVKDKAGNTTTCPANQTVKIDKTAPTCTSSGGNSSWTNGSRTIKGTCSDKGGSGCTGNVSKTFNSETNTTNASPGTVKDNAGNSASCPANQTVKIDKTAPTCTSSGGSNSWTNGSRTIKGTCSDKGGSGCTGNVSKTFNSETNTNKASPGTVKDNAGNSASCPADQTVKIDRTAPTCTSSGGSNSWTNNSRIIVGICSDGGSGCVGNVSKAFTSETNVSKISPGTVKDKAGNTAICPANQTVKIDKTAPTCTSSGGSNSWRNTNLTIKGTCSDKGGSGCSGDVNRTYTSNTNTTNASPGTVKDNAGNSASCPANQTVRIDKTPPTCISSGGSSSWTNSSRTLIGTCRDEGGSGCTGNVSKIFTSETNITNASPGSVKDNAGNHTTCPADQTIRIDNTAPTLSVVLKKKSNSTDLSSSSNINSLSNYSNNSWYSGYVVLRGSCSDSNDCTVSYKVTGASTNTNGYVNGTTRNINAQGTSTVEFRATDAAGNVTTKKYTVKLDRTRPTVSYNYSGGTYKQKTLKVCVTVKDSVGIDNIRFRIYKSGKEIKDINRTSVNATSKQECYTLSGYGSYTVYAKAYDYANNKQSKSPENDYGYYYQTYTLKSSTKKMYLCRNGDTFINRRKTTSCSNSESNAYNCAVTLSSNISSPRSVTVKSELDGNFYVLVDPIVRTFDGTDYEFKYIYKNCLTTDSTPSDCTKACQDH